MVTSVPYPFIFLLFFLLLLCSVRVFQNRSRNKESTVGCFMSAKAIKNITLHSFSLFGYKKKKEMWKYEKIRYRSWYPGIRQVTILRRKGLFHSRLVLYPPREEVRSC